MLNKMGKILILLTLILALNITAEASIKVDPSRIILHLEPGERKTGTIQIYNNSHRELDLIANLYDWDLDEMDNLVDYESGTLDHSLDGLVRFNPRQFTLEPGETQLVRFTISFPEEEDPFERRGIIFFEHEDPFEDEEVVGAKVRTMIGTTIYAMPEAYEISLYYFEGLIHEDSEGTFWGALLLGNDSQVHTRMNIDYRVIDDRGAVIEEGRSEERVMLPQDVRGIYFPLEEEFNPGDYQLLFDINLIGIDYSISETIDFEIE